MAENAKKKSGFLRILAIAAGALVALILLAALIVPALIPWDKVKVQAEEKVSRTIRHQVTIGSVGFNLFRGIEIRKLRIANGEGFSPQPLLSSEAAIVKYRLLPLLWGQVAVKAVVLDKPELLIERQADGRFNFSDMISKKEETPAEAPAQPEAKKGPAKIPVGVLVSRIAINQAALTFRDLKTSKAYAVEEFNFDLRNLTLAGLVPAHLALSAKLSALGAAIPVKATADWRLQFSQQRFLLDGFQAEVPGVVLKAQGAVEQMTTQPTLDISGTADLDFAKALAGFGPLAGGKLPKDFALTGTGSLRFKAAGPAKDPAALELTLNDTVKAQASALGMAIPVTLEGDVALAKANLDVSQRLAVPGLGAELSTQVADVMQARNVKAKLSARLDLAEASAKLVPPAQAQKLSAVKAQGRIVCTAAVTGPASDPKKMDINAQVKADQVSAFLQGKSLLENVNGTISVLPNRISLPGLTGRLGGQPIKAALLASGFDLRNPATLKPDALQAQVDWNVESQLLDVDALLALVPAKKTEPQADQKAASATAPAIVSDLPEPDARKFIPKGLKMRGTAVLGGLKFGQVKLGKMDFRTELAGQVLTETGTLLGYQGSIRQKVRLDFTRSLLGYAVDAETKTVDLEPLLNDVVDTFVAAKLKKPELIAELKGKLTGRLNGKLQIAGAGMRTHNAKPRLTGKGAFTLKDGRIRQFSFQEQLAKWFGSDKFKQDIPFDNTVVEFAMANQEVDLTKFVAESGPKGEGGEIRMEAEGRLTFAAAFKDFKLRPSLSPRAAGKISPEFSQYAEVLKNDRGWVTIPVVMNGPIKKPDVQPDWDWIKKQFGSYVQKKTKAAADEAGKKLQGFIDKEKGKSPDQIKQDAGREIEKAKDQLQNLKNLFH